MATLREMRSQAKAEEKAEAAKLQAELMGIAGQLLYGNRSILVELMNHSEPVSDPDDQLGLPMLADLGLLEVETVGYTERYSLSPLGKRVAEFILGLPYHHFINVDNHFVGLKFDGNRPLKETAKLIKKEILDCERQGILPQGKYSVRSEGNDIDLKLTSKNIQPGRLDRDANVQSIIRCISNQYNRGSGRGAFDVWQTHVKEE